MLKMRSETKRQYLKKHQLIQFFLEVTDAFLI